jgi:valyl-tRNA synthetase
MTRPLPSRVVAEEAQKTVAEQLDELGAQLDWVREYL